jgi:UDP-N-acetylglucosamine/UDP-N-acetyl-alpha-D-glucosaminouronate 4-epimerase
MAAFLVTGGAGFIGSHLVEELLRRGEIVRVVDNLSTGKWQNLDAAVATALRTSGRARGGGNGGDNGFQSVDFVDGDLANVDVARAAVDGIEVVLHQAAVPSVPRSIDEPLRSHQSNIDATFNVLVAARDAKVRRVVFAGSSSEYGDTPTLPKHEDMPLNPLSPYALQKVVGEQYLQQFTRHYGLETVSIRYFNVFGPRQDPSSPYSGVISLFVRALLDGRQPTIYGDGEQTRDFTYVANVVDGVLRAAATPGISGEIMNVATGGRTSLNALLAILQRLIGTNVAPLYGPPRKGDVRDSQADISKAERLLGYRTIVDLEEGLRRTVDWYRTA